MLANHTKNPPIADAEFQVGTRVLAAVNKIGIAYLKKEFQRDARRFLEDFTNSVLSTVASRSKTGQRLSCFCPEIVLGGDKHAPLHQFGRLLDGLSERGGSRAVRSGLVGLNTSPLTKSSDSWSGTKRGAART